MIESMKKTQESGYKDCQVTSFEYDNKASLELNSSKGQIWVEIQGSNLDLKNKQVTEETIE